MEGEQFASDVARKMREERDRVVTDTKFRRSLTLARLLDFLVEYVIANNGTSPKSYTIAVDALGRSTDYDPATDSYPRVMVGRLRAMLADYYARNPSATQLVIPVGSYLITLAQPQQLPTARQTTSPNAWPSRQAERRGWLILAALTVAVGLLVAMLALSMKDTADGTFQLSIAARHDAAGETPRRADDAADMAAHLLQRFGKLTTVLVEDDGDGTSDYRLVVTAPGEGAPGAEVGFFLYSEKLASPIWTARIPWSDVADENQENIGRLVSHIAGDYGAIVRAHLAANRDSFQPGTDCLAQFNEFRRNRDPALADPVEGCLRASITKFPAASYVYGDALSFILFAKAQYSKDPAPIRREATMLAEQAFAAGGNGSAKAVFSLARARFFEGDCAKGASLSERALQANPFDGDLFSYAGSYQYSCNLPRAGSILERAIEIDGDSASIALISLAYIRLNEQRPQEALALAARVTPTLRQEPQVDMVRACALYDMGQREEGMAVWQRLVRRINASPTTKAEDVAGRFISNPATAKRAAALVRARGFQP